MSIIEVGHIQSNCDSRFRRLIDLSDVQKKESEVEKYFRTRSLAAFVIADLALVDDTIAADAVVDESGDDGIDAFYYDKVAHRTYLVQSKWAKDGKATIDAGSTLKFSQGFKHFIDPSKHGKLGGKLRRKDSEIQAALSDINNRFSLVVAYTGEADMAPEAKLPLDELTLDVNKTQEWATLTVLRQSKLHEMVVRRSIGEPVQLDVLLHQWGATKHPYTMYYGQVSVAEIAQWGKHAHRLYDRNLRKFKGSTDVNEEIIGTLRSHPQDFLYFNNGITVVSSAVEQLPQGIGTPVGMFRCVGASVVNGAQTVGSIIRAHETTPLDETTAARVMVRLVSLKNCPHAFGDNLTRAANTQNKLERRDFAANDGQQERLMVSLLLSYKKRYVYKAEEVDVTGQPDACTIDEAAVALACAHSNIAYSMTAKREVGKLYEDTKVPPYTAIFNDSVSALRMWRAVLVMRAVDDALKPLQSMKTTSALWATHGNRFVLHLVFKHIGDAALDSGTSDSDFNVLLSGVARTAETILRDTHSVGTHLYAGSFAPDVFKNQTKCRAIAHNVMQGQIEHPQLPLFPDQDDNLRVSG